MFNLAHQIIDWIRKEENIMNFSEEGIEEWGKIKIPPGFLVSGFDEIILGRHPENNIQTGDVLSTVCDDNSLAYAIVVGFTENRIWFIIDSNSLCERLCDDLKEFFTFVSRPDRIFNPIKDLQQQLIDYKTKL